MATSTKLFRPAMAVRRNQSLRRMSIRPAFNEVEAGPMDPMFVLKRDYENDTHPSKVDLGVGVLRDEQGQTYELAAVQKAKRRLQERGLDHDYRPTTGIISFRDHAARLMFGKESSALKEKRIATIQTVAGTGACRLAAVLLNKHWPRTFSEGATGPFRNDNPVYVGVPTWGNYDPLFKHAGLPNVRTYEHLDEQYNLKFESTISAMREAPSQSIFVLQAVCHNPTGQDFSQDQWREMANLMLEKGHFAYLDTAYQGLGNGLDQDAWAIRYFAEKGVDMLVCQSFSKNMGLYSERVGALHVVCSSSGIAANVLDQLRSFTRWEVSSSPAYGAQLVECVLDDASSAAAWEEQLDIARRRLRGLRTELHGLLTKRFETPSPRTGTVEGWNHLIEENGLFSFTGLEGLLAKELIEKHHVYLTRNGRINVSGMNAENVQRVAQAFDDVVRARR